MKIVILDRKVYQNLVLFRHLIHRLAEKRNQFFQVAKKSYEAYVHCKTGELQFADLLKKKKKFSKEWKPIIIQLRPSQEGAFEVVSPENSSVFDCLGFSKEGYLLFSKTLRTLNELAYSPKQNSNPFWILRQVAHIDFILSEKEEGRRNLVHEAWHNLDREGAEALLKNSPPGTYLFRKDEFASLLEDELNKGLSDPVVCITLTYRDWDEKISEKTLVRSHGKWGFYQDGLQFSEVSYESVKELLATMGKELSSPLLAD